jgi:hypothetical protein
MEFKKMGVNKNISILMLFDFRCKMIYHIPPSRAHDDSKQKGDIHMDMCSPIKNDQHVRVA